MRAPRRQSDISPLPAGVEAARAQARFAGLVRLPMGSPSRPIGHLSYLTLEMHGAAIREPERTRTAPWRLGRNELSDERAIALGRRALDAERIAATHDPR